MGFVGDALGAVGGFVGDAVGSVLGGVTGGINDKTGATNKFNAQPANSFFTSTTPTINYSSQSPQSGFSASAPSVSPVMNSFRAQQAPIDLSNYAGAVAQSQGQAAGGQGPASAAIGGQNQLASMLLQQAYGAGPSLAQGQLEKATQQNAANAQSLIASQKGINPGLARRQIMQSAAGANQAAAGDSALIRMQEQLNAQGMLGNILNQQGTLALGQQGVGIQGMGTAGGLQNAQNTSMIQNLMSAQGLNAGVAGQNAASANQVGLANAGNNLAAQGLNQQTSLANLNAGVQTNAQNASLAGEQARLALGSQQLNQLTQAQNAQNILEAQRINAGVAKQNSETAANTAGGLMGGISALPFLLHDGGEVPGYAGGGPVDPMMLMKMMGSFKAAGGGGGSGWAGATAGGIGGGFAGMIPGIMKLLQRGEGGPSAIEGSPLPPGGGVPSPYNAPWSGADPLAPYGSFGQGYDQGGGVVPGRAEVSGDSSRNDKVPIMASPGEIVVPRSITTAPDAPERAAAFIEQVKRSRERDPMMDGYGSVLMTQRMIADRIRRMAAGGVVDPMSDLLSGPETTEEEGRVRMKQSKKYRVAKPGEAGVSTFNMDADRKPRKKTTASKSIVEDFNELGVDLTQRP